MTSAALLEAPVIEACGICGLPIMKRFTRTQRFVKLDAERVPVGLYDLDEHGRAVRRSLAAFVAEGRGESGSGGYVEHKCPWKPSRA